MFTSVENRGFQIQFSNGWTISVQFGPGNYCERQGLDYDAPLKERVWKSQTAEVAAWDSEGTWYDLDNSRLLDKGDTGVYGYVDANTVAHYIDHISSMS